jgi:predicted nucleotide-binding protein
MGKKILFQGSYAPDRSGQEPPPQLRLVAEAIAVSLGDGLIAAGFDLIFTGASVLDETIAGAAISACHKLGEKPRERIRTYSADPSKKGFGMVLEPFGDIGQDIRTFVVREADAVIGLIGGKGTSDCIQKAVFAGKPVFPVATVGGASQAEWKKLKREGHFHRIGGDIDFLADRNLDPETLAATIVRRCEDLFSSAKPRMSNRIFIVHGHDGTTKLELARLLDRLGLVPVILAEQADRGRTVLGKLIDELDDVGYGIVLLTPDDVGRSVSTKKTQPRARQNVVFEHGWLIGALGTKRVCAIVKDRVEVPSDLAGLVYKNIPAGQGIDAIATEIVKELKSAGYAVDANKIFAS